MTPDSQKTQVRTFYLLWCEDCSHAAEPGPPPERPAFVAPSDGPMRCNDCGDPLHLVECFTAAESKVWQAAPGSAWRRVVCADDLPRARWPEKQAGRSRWVEQ